MSQYLCGKKSFHCNNLFFKRLQSYEKLRAIQNKFQFIFIAETELLLRRYILYKGKTIAYEGRFV